MDQGNVTIGKDAAGNAIVTGDNNLTVVLIGTDKLPDDLIEALKSGRLRAADLPGAVLLPALTLAIAPAGAARTQWTIRAHRATGEPTERAIAAPHGDAAVSAALDTFWRLSRVPIETRQDADSLDAAAIRIGDALAQALTNDEATLLADAARGNPPPPLLVIESEDEQILGLPWELLRLEQRFALRDGRLDVARSVPAPFAPVLAPPTAPVSLLVTVAAPEGSGLDHERETFFIVRALHEHLGVVINEMGEVADLVEGLRRGDPPPVGVHFSGHGGPGLLEFEDEFGERDPVTVDDLLAEIRRHTSGRLPHFFYLACCHGGDAPSSGETGGLRSVATALHRDGIAQVVGYFGPVLDELSTRAERSFYAALAEGRRTRDAVRLARAAMAEAQAVVGRSRPRDAGGRSSGGDLPYAWAQMVLYQRGPDHPLGTKIAGSPRIVTETTERRAEAPYPGSRTRVLKAGFVGRRKEMHALRRDLRAGRHLHVVQGTGGLGKSTFCTEALKVYARLGWQRLALWCPDSKADPDPLTSLVRQVEAGGGQLLGGDWDQVLAALDREAAQEPRPREPAARLLRLLQVLLQVQESPLVLYLDNLESLQTGPADDSAEPFAAWRDAECAALWQGLRDLQSEQSGRFAVLASSRYQHPGFGAVVPFRRLPDDALGRMLPWFPSLRRLSKASRFALEQRLAGHPRSVEFLDALIAEAILTWESQHGPFEPGRLSAAEEQAQIIDTTLPTLDAQLSEDLLFGALWDRVLDPTARDLLVRAGVLRRPGQRALIEALAGAGNEAAIDRLRKTGLLSEIRETEPGGRTTTRYEVHPSVARLANRRSADAESLRQDGHRRAGNCLEALAVMSRSWEENIEGASHLLQIGEADRAWDLIGLYAQELQDRGRVQESLAILARFDDPSKLHARRGAQVLDLRGIAAEAYGDLPEALSAYRASLLIRERLAASDGSNAGWQRDLSVSQNKIGDVLSAQGRLDEALSAYRACLLIFERLAASDGSNAGWQRDLSVSQNKIGDVLSAQGRLDEALSAYRACLLIFERLAASDGSNAGWQRDVAVTCLRIGAISEQMRDAADAGGWYAKAEPIIRRLTALDPTNAQWRSDQAYVEARLAGGWSRLWSWRKR